MGDSLNCSNSSYVQATVCKAMNLTLDAAKSVTKKIQEIPEDTAKYWLKKESVTTADIKKVFVGAALWPLLITGCGAPSESSGVDVNVGWDIYKSTTLSDQEKITQLNSFFSTNATIIAAMPPSGKTRLAELKCYLYSLKGDYTNTQLLANRLLGISTTALTGEDAVFETMDITGLMKDQSEGIAVLLGWALYKDTTSTNKLTQLGTFFTDLKANFQKLNISTYSPAFKANIALVKAFYYYMNAETLKAASSFSSATTNYNNSLQTLEALLGEGTALPTEDADFTGFDKTTFDSTDTLKMKMQKVFCLLGLGRTDDAKAYITATAWGTTDTKTAYTLLALKQIESYGLTISTDPLALANADKAIALAAYVSYGGSAASLSTVDQFFAGNIDITTVTDGTTLAQNALEGALVSKGWAIYNNPDATATPATKLTDLSTFISGIKTSYPSLVYSTKFQANLAEVKLNYYFLKGDYANTLLLANRLLGLSTTALTGDDAAFETMVITNLDKKQKNGITVIKGWSLFNTPLSTTLTEQQKITNLTTFFTANATVMTTMSAENITQLAELKLNLYSFVRDYANTILLADRLLGNSTTALTGDDAVFNAMVITGLTQEKKDGITIDKGWAVFASEPKVCGPYSCSSDYLNTKSFFDTLEASTTYPTSSYSAAFKAKLAELKFWYYFGLTKYDNANSIGKLIKDGTLMPVVTGHNYSYDSYLEGLDKTAINSGGLANIMNYFGGDTVKTTWFNGLLIWP